MNISACLIVKNEEKSLERCLKSLEGVDELLICDTGSEDKTVEIAKGYTNKIYHFDWIDDFAAARNFICEKATGDWIISIDADNWLEKNGVEKLKTIIESLQNGEDCISVEYIYANTGIRTSYAPRVFKNGLKWIGAIHEVVAYTKIINCDVEMYHTPSPAHKLDPYRNMRILEKEHNRIPNCTRTMFYYGRELWYYRKYDECLDILLKYVEISTFLAEKNDALYMIADCYWRRGKGEGDLAREYIFKCIKNNPMFKGALKLAGEMHHEPWKSKWIKLSELADNSDVLFNH